MPTTTFKVIPLKSVNGVEFGASREEVWKQFGKPTNSFKKFEDDKSDSDAYDSFIVYYDDDNKLEAIEFFDEVDIECDGKKLPKTFSKLLAFFKDRYKDLEFDDFEFTTVAGSIGASIKDEEDDSFESILFGREGYYA